MSSFDVSALGQWFDRPSAIDDSVPIELISIPNRQETVYPGQQTTIIIPREHSFLSNGHMVFEVNTTFPYYWAPQPNTCLTATGYPGLSAFKNPEENSLLAPYNRTLPYDVATYLGDANVTALYAANTGSLAGYAGAVASLAYGIPDYALDPPRNLGHYVHLDRFVLEQSSGSIIYERSAATSWDGLITLALGTTTGPEFFATDLMLGTGIAQNAPGIDPFLVPPPYTRGTRRANSFVISPDRTQITFTKEVNLPLPLPFKNLPVQFMSDKDLNLQITMAPNALLNMVAETQYFTGKLNLFQDSEMAYAGSLDTVSLPTGDDTAEIYPAVGQQTIFTKGLPGGQCTPPIENVCIYPIFPNAACSGPGQVSDLGTGEQFSALPFSRGGEKSVLQLTLNGVFLDTSDLSDILGAPELIDPIGYPQNPAHISDPAYCRPSYPTCSILNNGLVIKARLSKMDIPASSGCGSFTATITSSLPTLNPLTGLSGATSIDPKPYEDDYDYYYGHRVLRDVWISQFVHASQIASITLRHRHPIAPVTADATVTSIATGVTLDDNTLGSKGQVYVEFSTPVLLKVPLYGFNGCNVTSAATAGQAQTIAFMSLVSCSHSDAMPNMGNNWLTGLYAQNWELDLVVCTNAWSLFGSKRGPQLPVIPKTDTPADINAEPGELSAQQNLADCPMNGRYVTQNCYSIGTGSEGATGNSYTPTFPLYVQPSSITYTNLRITFDKPLLAQKYIDGMAEMYNDPDTGLPITFVEMTSLKFPMQNQGFITWQTSPRQIFFLRMGMRCALNPLPFGVRPYIPLTSFSTYELTQGGVQVKIADATWAPQVLGNCWPVQRTCINDPQLVVQPLGFLKGSGGNSYFQEQMEIAIGNCYNRTDLSTGEPAFTVNMSYLNMVRGVWDIWYSMNTHGGAATIPVFTQWQLRYSLTNAMEYKMYYPVQILRNSTGEAYPYVYTENDPFQSGGYAASQTYATRIETGLLGNQGSWGYPQDVNSLWAYSHYLWDMCTADGAGPNQASIGGYVELPSGGTYAGVQRPAASAAAGEVTYGFQRFQQWDDNILFNASYNQPMLLEIQVYHRRRITFYRGKAAATGADIGLFVSTN